MALTIKSFATTTTANPALNTHAVDDMILICSMDNTSSIPNLHTNFTNIDTATGGSSGGDCAGRFAYKRATSTSETLAGGSAVRKGIWIISGVDWANPIGDFDENTTNSTTATLDALTLADANSYVFAGIRSDAGATPSDPTGMSPADGSGGVGNSYWFGHIGPTGTFTSRTSTVGSARWLTQNVEVRAAITTITADLAKTEDADTLDADGANPIAGTLSKTESVDVLSGVGNLSIAGTLSKTEDADTLEAEGDYTPLTGVLDKTEEADVVASAGVLPISGIFDKTEDGDILDADGEIAVIGSLIATEDADTLEAEGGPSPLTGTLTKTESNETLSAAGANPISGSLSKTEGLDTLESLGGNFTGFAGTGQSANVQPTAIVNKIIYAGV